ncbi:MAG: hypothetical protein BGO05_14185 [Rhizobiales bacterium 63-7]|nr:MAG: hypothetical protein BGO05_14185 [Rhizobiales bacterium 63-7]
MTDLKEFASSSNGDKWFLGKGDPMGVLFVLHRGMPPLAVTRHARWWRRFSISARFALSVRR